MLRASSTHLSHVVLADGNFPRYFFGEWKFTQTNLSDISSPQIFCHLHLKFSQGRKFLPLSIASRNIKIYSKYTKLPYLKMCHFSLGCLVSISPDSSQRLTANGQKLYAFILKYSCLSQSAAPRWYLHISG